jgi:hypothetical protein
LHESSSIVNIAALRQAGHNDISLAPRDVVQSSVDDQRCLNITFCIGSSSFVSLAIIVDWDLSAFSTV